MSSYNHFGCSWCRGPFNGGNCSGCSSVGFENEFVYDPNPYSYNETANFFNQPPQHQYETYSCELCGDSPHYGFDCQTRTPLVYEQDPCNNQNFSNDQSPYYSPSQPQQFDCCEVCGGPHYSSNCQTRNQLVYEANPGEPEGSDDYTEPFDTLLMGDEVISIILARKTDEFIKSSVDDLVPISRESEVTSDREYIVDLLMKNEDVAGLPRHLVKYLFNHLLKNPSLTKGMSDEPLGDDSKPRSYDVTFSNPLFDFNDDFTLCNDNPIFDEEFEDISSLDPPELTPVIDEPTFLVTLPLPCTDVLGDAIVDIDLPLGEPLDTLSTEDREIGFNPNRDIDELERLLADDPVPVPRVFDEPLGISDSMSRSSETSDLFEELIAEIGLDDSIPIGVDDRYYDSEGDILYFEQLLNEVSSSDVSPTLLPIKSSLLVPPLPDPKQIFLREVERFDPFFSLTQSGERTRVMETSSFGFHHMPSPRPATYSFKEVMYLFNHPHLTSGDGFDHGSKMK
ncbi:hypothetical protein Tco_0586196 [Tanacetum coccineum]